MTPKSIKENLDKEIIGQEKSKAILSFAFYLHLMRNNRKDEEKLKNPLPKSNILVLGSSGSGKRLMIRSLTETYDLPCLKIDCSIFLTGQNLHEVMDAYIRYMILQFGVEKASKGVFVFEDFDKIANRQMAQNHLSYEIQDEMLALLEQQERLVAVEEGKPPILFPVANLMFIFSGRFQGIEPLIYMRNRVDNKHDIVIQKKEQRLALIAKYRAIRAEETKGQSKPMEAIGFRNLTTTSSVPTPKESEAIIKAIEELAFELREDELEDMVDAAFQKELLSDMNDRLKEDQSLITEVQYQDIVNYGMLPELAGRIGFIAAFERLTQEEIIRILKRPSNNVIDHYKNYFSLHDDVLEIKEEVYPLIAAEVAERNIGTRSINTIIVQLLEELLYIAPDKKKDKFVIDAAYFTKRIK